MVRSASWQASPSFDGAGDMRMSEELPQDLPRAFFRMRNRRVPVYRVGIWGSEFARVYVRRDSTSVAAVRVVHEVEAQIITGSICSQKSPLCIPSITSGAWWNNSSKMRMTTTMTAIMMDAL